MFSKSKPLPSNALTPPLVSGQPKGNKMSNGSTFSVIGSDVTITGNIKAGVDLHIDGRVDGDISCASLVQGEGSEIHGAIKAETARLAGTVHGSIDARELVICASARVTGDVFYQVITVEHGGHVDGQFKHKDKATQLRTAPEAGDKPAVTLAAG